MEVTQYYIWNSQNVDKLSTCANSGYQALFRTGLGTRLNAHLIEQSWKQLVMLSNFKEIEWYRQSKYQ